MSQAPDTLPPSRLAQAETFIQQEEGAAHRLTGKPSIALTALAVTMSVFHLYAAYSIVPTQTLRTAHVGLVLVLSFLSFAALPRDRNRIRWWDWLLAAASLAVVAYILTGGDDFTDRATTPNAIDMLTGGVLLALVLEATRRTTGWVMPAVSLAFLAYAVFGAYLPAPWTHRGYDLERLVGHLYMTLEGLFGTAVDVSATLIALFTIYGAVLKASGAGKFFIDLSLAVMGHKPAGAGRTVVMSSFLLGGPSGSGVATTVTLGSMAYPLLAKAGYSKNEAGGLLAAGGLGAILSPPVLGAAAFLIAEFLKISYLDVVQMAIIPTLLYYFSLFLMVELDARKFNLPPVSIERTRSAWQLIKTQGFHFSSLIAIVVFMLLGWSATLSVFWATVVAFAGSFLNRDCALTPHKLISALQSGSVSLLNVAATCTCAGIIVGVVTLTGLGLKFSDIIITYAGQNLLLTALYTALIVWVVGLAVPVTASYIICAVITAPALIKLGVPDYAAHMFIFYYAVLSEVSPPTALSPFAAAAITGGNPYRTTLQSWKYTLPAFVVPFMFVLAPSGLGLLLKGDANDILMSSLTALLGIASLAAGAQGWLLKATRGYERWLLVGAGLLLAYPSPACDIIGLTLAAAAALSQKLRH